MKLSHRNIVSWAIGASVGYYAGQILRYLPSWRGWCAISVCGHDITPLVGGFLVGGVVSILVWYWLE